MYRQSWRNILLLLINSKLPRLNHGTFPITCSFTLSSKNLLWFVIDSKTELIKIAIFQIKLNSPSNSQPSTMQWHDMIVLKTLFLKELVSKSAILNEVIDFEIKQFWNQTFFSTLSRAQLGKPDWSRILTESQKSSQQNSAVFHTRQYSGTHYARFVNFLSRNCLNLKVNRNMFFIL